VLPKSKVNFEPWVKLGIDVLLFEHLQSRCIDSSMYHYILMFSSCAEFSFDVLGDKMIVQCSSELCEPKYTCNTRQPNTHIRAYIYARTRIQYTRICLISMYELIYCLVFCQEVIVVFNDLTATCRARKSFHYFEYAYTRIQHTRFCFPTNVSWNKHFAVGHC